MSDYIFTNMNVSVDGRGYAGKVEDWTPPVPAFTTEEFRAGGMDAAIDIIMGMEKLTTSMNFVGIQPEIIKGLGVVAGGVLPLTGRAVLEDIDGTVHPALVQMRARITKTDFGTWKSGQKAMLSIEATLLSYGFTIDGEEMIFIDKPNMVRRIGGVDQLAQHRRALGR